MSDVSITAALQADLAAAEAEGNDPLWYQDAVIYEVHVKAFSDSNGDGMGDFKGLTEKLDYIHSLGVNTIWLLPFYPSPLKDDGYDIADYCDVHPDYGTLGDLIVFIREAHQRNLRVITELVINHTSDQHPWFQAARRAPEGSPERDFYMWSKSNDKYAGTRIIFTDTEKSNWAWDEEAHAYYWHRFFTHQPSLNYENPAVLKAVIDVMRFWLDLGVDGLRLDAIPYLRAREGTSSENLPETHAVLKQIRAVIDAHYSNCMLLAEANQWPEDVRDYFGDGDECHMAYHFPLMPRIYMAIGQEDRHPIVEIMQQTPDIPANCQWAIFLRNHDELTLEMVTSRERDYMYKMYAADPRARLNLGIRRRLAPLMDNDTGKINLMNSLLLSMPGSPIVYYGDEIGMGDNVYLGDRDGVRTPMQWSPDRNAGFSRADPQRLYLPPIMDAVYGYHVVNAESQLRNSSSLLNWMRRVLAVRNMHHAFGRGKLEFLQPENRKVLAYLRTYREESFLCVANLARSAQPVELKLERYHGYVPIEMMGQTAFPLIGELPYLLTLPGHGFYWFRLIKGDDVAARGEELVIMAELPVLVLFDGWNSLFRERVVPWRIALADRLRLQFEGDVLPRFVGAQRWYAAHGAGLQKVALLDCTEFGHTEGADGKEPLDWLLAIFDLESKGDQAGHPAQASMAQTSLEQTSLKQFCFLPLALEWEGVTDEAHMHVLQSTAIAKVRQQAQVGLLIDAFADEAFCLAMVAALGSNRQLRCARGSIRFSSTSVYAGLIDSPAALLPVSLLPAQSSNTTVDLGGRLFLKGFRRLRPGLNPEVEMGRYLTETAEFSNSVPLLGTVEYIADDGGSMTLAMAQAYVENQGDGWAYTLDYLARFFEQCGVEPEQPPDVHGGYLALVSVLAQRTGELHQVLALPARDPAFNPEPIGQGDLHAWVERISAEATATFDQLMQARGAMAESVQSLADALLARRAAIVRRIGQCMPVRAAGYKCRYHGDYHLGQVLLVNNDFVIIDFEGEPGRTMDERRQKHSPLRDIAGMLRSFNYAMYTALYRSAATRPEAMSLIEPHAHRWEAETARVFIESYRAATRSVALHAPWEDAAVLLELFLLEKTLYELRYEMQSRPDWVRVPLRGMLDMTAGLV